MAEKFLTSVLPQHEAAELYRLMAIGIQELAVSLVDPHGIITVWNKGAQQMKGYTAEEAIGGHLRFLDPDEYREQGLPEHNLAAAREHGFYSKETWRKRKDGSLFWAHVAITALRDADENLLGFSKVTLDLTHHKLLEQCHKEKEEIDLILHAAETGTWKWNIARDEVEVSSHLLHLLGYEGGTRTLSFDCWLSFVHREQRAAFRSRLEAVRADPGSRRWKPNCVS